MGLRIQMTIVAVLAGAMLAGCQSGMPTTGPVSTALPPAEKPVTAVGSKYDYLVDGDKEITLELVASEGGYESWERSDGRSWKWANVFAPVIEFASPDGQGQQTIDGDMNDLFPLEIGKSATVHYRGQSTTDPSGWSGSRRCTVEAQESLTVAAGTFDAYKVVCIQGGRLARPGRTLTYYYAPDVQLIVYRHQRRRGQRNNVLELLRL